jgi:hypothetical protein
MTILQSKRGGKWHRLITAIKRTVRGLSGEPGRPGVRAYRCWLQWAWLHLRLQRSESRLSAFGCIRFSLILISSGPLYYGSRALKSSFLASCQLIFCSKSDGNSTTVGPFDSGRVLLWVSLHKRLTLTSTVLHILGFYSIGFALVF